MSERTVEIATSLILAVYEWKMGANTLHDLTETYKGDVYNGSIKD